VQPKLPSQNFLRLIPIFCSKPRLVPSLSFCSGKVTRFPIPTPTFNENLSHPAPRILPYLKKHSFQKETLPWHMTTPRFLSPCLAQDLDNGFFFSCFLQKLFTFLAGAFPISACAVFLVKNSRPIANLRFPYAETHQTFLLRFDDLSVRGLFLLMTDAKEFRLLSVILRFTRTGLLINLFWRTPFPP